MWKETRQRQMAQFQNMEIGSEHQIEGHGAHAVTPEQVSFTISIGSLYLTRFCKFLFLTFLF